jgi:hypothetical protein
VDGRWSLYDGAVLLSDEDGELKECFINSLQFRVGALTPAEVAALGGPSAGGIPANFPVPARLFIEWQAGDLVITWPESVTGYTLQSSPALGPAASWTDITDVTIVDDKYTAVQTPNEPARFYRLWK